MGKRRLKDRRGETIAETLIAVMVIALAFVMMCGAVLSSGRVNESVKNEDISFSLDKVETTASTTVTLSVKETDPSNPAGKVQVVSQTYNVTPGVRKVEKKDGTKEALYTYYK